MAGRMATWHHSAARRGAGQRASARGGSSRSSAQACLWALLAVACLGIIAAPLRAGALHEIRYWSLGEVTRVVVQVDGEFSLKWNRLEGPPRAFFDLPGVDLSRIQDGQPRAKVRIISVNDPLLKQIRYAENAPNTSRVVLDLNESCEISTSQLANPSRLVIELRTRKAALPGIQSSRTGAATQSDPGRVSDSDSDLQSVSIPTAASTAASAPDASLPTNTASAMPGASAPPTRTNDVGAASASASSRASGAPITATTASTPVVITTPAPRQVETIVIDGAENIPDSGVSAKPAVSTVSGRQSLVRALGLKIGRVVLDPGHGGQDHGTTGTKGLREKDLVLDVALRLAKLVREEMGSEVVLTREDDTFIPLEERTAIANRHRADLFLSIHANSSPYKLAYGPETFFLNFTTSRESMDVAMRENATAQRSVGELQDIVRKITLKDKRDESEDFASKIQSALFATQRRAGIKARNRGVKSAPFVVLVGAEMPSVLVEIGFLSNPAEEAKLKTSEYRDQIAQSLLRGLQRYVDSLSHFEGKERAAK